MRNIIDKTHNNVITAISQRGKTTQPGTGDPSPTNIRPIYGVGQFDKKVVLDGVINKFVSVSGVRKNLYYTAALAPDAANAGSATSAIALSNKYTVVAWDVLANDGLFIHFSIHPNGYVGIAFDGTMDDANTWLISHPLTIWYLSTAYPTATQVYVGLSVTDANGYHGYAAGPTAPLFDGDTLTWSGGSTVEVVRANEKLVLNGTEDWRLHGSGKYFELFVNKNGEPNVGVCDTFLYYYNYGSKSCIFVLEKQLFVSNPITASYDFDVEKWKAELQQHNTTVVYGLATPTTETVAISEPITYAPGPITIAAENTVDIEYGYDYFYEPKKDWIPSDYWNAVDYNYVRDNLAYLTDMVERLYNSCSAPLTEQATTSSLVYENTINVLERSIDAIAKDGFSPAALPTTKTWGGNGACPKAEDINRIESSIELLYGALHEEELARQKLSLKLGLEEF